MTIDRLALLDWLLPHCEPDTASVLYRKGKDVTSPLHGRLEMLRQAMQDADRCRQQLVETCPDEELRTHLADLQRRHDEAHDRSFKLRQTLNDCRTWAKSCRTWAKSDRTEVTHASSPRKEQELRARAERHEAKAAECETELAEVLKQLAGLEKQMQAVRDAMLEP